MNCGCTDGKSHSKECIAEHTAACAGGFFGKWLPIDSAPKDGTEILLFWPYVRKASSGKFSGIERGSYQFRADDIVGLTEGFMCDGDLCIPTNQDDCTHWMPLPPPPVTLNK
jgi:hypothetical protein